MDSQAHEDIMPTVVFPQQLFREPDHLFLPPRPLTVRTVRPAPTLWGRYLYPARHAR